MIGIIDYGMGNLLSVKNAVEYLGCDVKIVASPSDLLSCEKLILPGVGAFTDCMKNLNEKGFIQELNNQVLEHKKPILGICLGMQVMARNGFEGGVTRGLGWIDANVELVTSDSSACRIPHVGWSETTFSSHPLFDGIKDVPEFYFVHSYHMNVENKNEVIATFDHGGVYTAAVAKNNIMGCQFHPEKSQEFGLKVLDNFTRKNFF
jgi:imidazole glycerol-phosphate synthase subunit HisH